MDWLKIVESVKPEEMLGHFATVGFITGGITYLARSYFKHFFDKRLERHKVDLQRQTNFDLEVYRAKLSTELETHKAKLKQSSDSYQSLISHELQLIKDERSVKFSKLHVERAEVIRSLYSHILSSRYLIDTSPLAQLIFPRDGREEWLNKCHNDVQAMISYFSHNKIYFSSEFCAKFKEFQDFLFGASLWKAHEINIEGEPNSSASSKTFHEKMGIVDDHYETVNKLNAMQEDLEEEFRKLLGVN